MVLNLYLYLDEGTYQLLILLSISYLFRSPIRAIELMLIQSLCLFKDTYTRDGIYIYLRFPGGGTYHVLILLYISYLFIELILIRRSLHLFGGTRRYYRDIMERILVLHNLFL